MSFIVITKIKYSASVKDEVFSLAEESLPIAKSQAGLISVRFHSACDKDETMMYWEWETQEAHERCMASEDWQSLTPRWDKLFTSGEAEFSLETFELLAQ